MPNYAGGIREKVMRVMKKRSSVSLLEALQEQTDIQYLEHSVIIFSAFHYIMLLCTLQ